MSIIEWDFRMKIHKKKPATKFLCYSAADRVFDTRNSAAGQLAKSRQDTDLA
jgi:hypothetical protein